MLFYISLYVVATILVLQGTQLLGELSTPREALPSEVRPGPVPAARWGGFLVTYGVAMIAVGLLSHGFEWFQGSLGLLRGFGVAIEKIIENITEIAIGMPRLPQAMAVKARKVAGTSSSPRRMGAACSICTAKNSGRPISGAGSICQNLPRRGPDRSGGAVTITPTAADDAAKAPSQA